MQRVLVTGANGFIGRAICKALSSRGFYVIGGIRSADRESGLTCDKAIITGDLQNGDSRNSAFEHCDVVVHTAGWSGEGPPGRAQKLAGGANVVATSNICKMAAANNVQQFIYISSIKAVGSITKGVPLTETSVPMPTDAYGVSKLSAEREIARFSGISRTIIRPPAVYGPGMKGGLLLLMRVASRGFPMPLKGINNRRDFLALPSLADFVVCCIETDNDRNENARIFHVRDGQPISTATLYDCMGTALQKKTKMLKLPPSIITASTYVPYLGPRLRSLTQSLELDDTQTRRVLNWAPRHDMKDVLVQTADWLLKARMT